MIVILFSHSYRLPQQILQLVLIRLDHLPHEHEVVTKKEYEKIVVPLVKAVQEQQEQIEVLQAQIKSLLAMKNEIHSDETMTGSDQ